MITKLTRRKLYTIVLFIFIFKNDRWATCLIDWLINFFHLDKFASCSNVIFASVDIVTGASTKSKVALTIHMLAKSVSPIKKYCGFPSRLIWGGWEFWFHFSPPHHLPLFLICLLAQDAKRHYFKIASKLDQKNGKCPKKAFSYTWAWI